MVWITRCSYESAGLIRYVLDSISLKCWIQYWNKIWEHVKTVSIKTCINRKDKINSSKFSYSVIFVAITMNFLSVVTPPYIYQVTSSDVIVSIILGYQYHLCGLALV